MKRIKVLHNYGGVLTHDLRILPGEYDATDERLFGTADYLVANGHAVVTVDEPEPEEPVEEVEPIEENLFDLTNPQLKEKLDAMGIEYKSNANKADLLELIGKHSDDPSESPVLE